VLITGVMLNDF